MNAESYEKKTKKNTIYCTSLASDALWSAEAGECRTTRLRDRLSSMRCDLHIRLWMNLLIFCVFWLDHVRYILCSGLTLSPHKPPSRPTHRRDRQRVWQLASAFLLLHNHVHVIDATKNWLQLRHCQKIIYWWISVVIDMNSWFSLTGFLTFSKRIIGSTLKKNLFAVSVLFLILWLVLEVI